MAASFHSRKLLLFPTYHQSPNPAAAATPPASNVQFSKSTTITNILDGNIILILSVLVCALICLFGLNSTIRCALRLPSLISSENSRGSIPTGERLANSGVKKQALDAFPVLNYSGDLKFPGLYTECTICLSEFAPGERIRVLPKCSHGFHVNCIDMWLNSHSSCPTCRHCLSETCEKIAGTEALVSTITPRGPPQETIVWMAPLEREGVLRDHILRVDVIPSTY